MDTITLDMRGKPCPAPVVETKKILDNLEEGVVVVIVDNEISKNNVERFAKKSGCSTDVSREDNFFKIIVTKGITCNIDFKNENKKEDKSKSYILYIKNSVMGHGDVELGNILIKAFFKTLLDNDKKPDSIIFLNKGVFLVCEDSEIIDELVVLEKEFKVEILSCGTCLDYYNLKEKVKIGVVSNMFDIQNKLITAENVVTP